MNTSFITPVLSDEAREAKLAADLDRLLNPPAPAKFDLDNPERFVLSWYGNGRALGGKPADLEQIVNVLHNHLDFEGHVNIVHKDFGYIVLSEEKLERAIQIISLIQAPKPYGKHGYEHAVSHADLFVSLIPHENFLLGKDDITIVYAQFVDELGVNRSATVSL